jgi:hypothetical protein
LFCKSCQRTEKFTFIYTKIDKIIKRMKRLHLLLLVLLCSTGLYGQSPEKMSYQAILRDAVDALIVNQGVGIQVSVLQGSASGTAVYVETHSGTTNTNGLVSLEIGMGTASTGTFSGIDWSGGPYFLKTETDPTALGGTSYTITGTTELLSVPYALHAKTAAAADNVPSYAIGDFAHGGIVFWIDETGQHGLVCAKSDQSTGIRWYAGTYGITRATGDGIYAGAANTSIIISSQVAIGDDGSPYAAQMCNDLQITEGGTTYGDWYLPSKYELNLMYTNKATIDVTAAANGGGGFAADWYWSSTENGNFSAWIQYFLNGFRSSSGKSGNEYVRAVRAF